MENIETRKILNFDVSQENVDKILDFLEDKISQINFITIKAILESSVGTNSSTYEELLFPDGTYKNSSIDEIFGPTIEALQFLKIEYSIKEDYSFSYILNNFNRD